MKRLLTLGCICFTGALVAQVGDYLVPLRTNPTQREAAALQRAQRTTVAPGDTLFLPTNGSGFTDDFSYDSYRPDTIMWDPIAVQPNTGNYSGVFVNRTWATAPIDLGVCTFDGLNFDGMPYNELVGVGSTAPADYLTSRAFNLQSKSVADSVYIRFFWQAQGRGYAPNAQDSFLLQFNYPAIGNDWVTVWFQNGYTPSFSDTNFHRVNIKLDNPNYFANGFRFRFRNYAAICGSNDHWHLDQVRIKDGSSLNDTVVSSIRYVYDPGSLLQNFRSMPWWHYNQSPVLYNTTIRLFIRNNNTQSGTTLNPNGYELRRSNGNLLYAYTGSASSNCNPYLIDGYFDDPGFPSAWNPPTAGMPNLPTFTGPDFVTVDYKFVGGNQGKDSVRSVQRFNNYYAYDDGTAEVGYGLFGTNSLLAYQFTLPPSVTDTLKAIQMYFLPVQDIDDLALRSFKLTIWSHNAAANEPGAIIYQQTGLSPEYAAETVNRFVTYTIDSGTVVLSGTYYIGWQQLAIDRLYLGFDFNTNRSDKIYYNTSGPWYTSIFEGALMMRPVFRTPTDLSGIGEESAAAEGQVLYPNPAADELLFRNAESGQPFAVQAFDMTGREVLRAEVSNGTLDVSQLPPGVYFFRLTHLQTSVVQTQRIVIAR